MFGKFETIIRSIFDENGKLWSRWLKLIEIWNRLAKASAVGCGCVKFSNGLLGLIDLKLLKELSEITVYLLNLPGNCWSICYGIC